MIWPRMYLKKQIIEMKVVRTEYRTTWEHRIKKLGQKQEKTLVDMYKENYQLISFHNSMV